MVASFASVSPFTVCRASHSKPTLTISLSLRLLLSVSFSCINYEMATVLFFSILLAICAAIYLSVCLSVCLTERSLIDSSLFRIACTHITPSHAPSGLSHQVFYYLSAYQSVIMSACSEASSASLSLSGLTTTHIITYAFFLSLIPVHTWHMTKFRLVTAIVACCSNFKAARQRDNASSTSSYFN